MGERDKRTLRARRIHRLSFSESTEEFGGSRAASVEKRRNYSSMSWRRRMIQPIVQERFSAPHFDVPMDGTTGARNDGTLPQIYPVALSSLEADRSNDPSTGWPPKACPAIRVPDIDAQSHKRKRRSGELSSIFMFMARCLRIVCENRVRGAKFQSGCSRYSMEQCGYQTHPANEVDCVVVWETNGDVPRGRSERNLM